MMSELNQGDLKVFKFGWSVLRAFYLEKSLFFLKVLPILFTVDASLIEYCAGNALGNLSDVAEVIKHVQLLFLRLYCDITFPVMCVADVPCKILLVWC